MTVDRGEPSKDGGRSSPTGCYYERRAEAPETMTSMASTDDQALQSLGPQLPYAMGRFTLCKEIGAGGMATVYLGKMRLAAGLDRMVALKTIHSHLAKEQTFVDMFLDEAKIASHISHPNVCSVYDFGSVGGIYYMAMEYLSGVPLFDFVNAIAESDNEDLKEALPFIAARIIADACEGLHAAHTLTGQDGGQLQVVHRDVSPQNLFVTYDGATKVVDFGCAKALERVTQTNTGVMKGKVSYAAPEQLQGEELDARVDVFALGVCLWECLTLQQLFRRDTAIKTAMAVLEEDIPRATTVASWVPEQLADIAEKALQRNPDDRFQSARAMGKALRSFIARSGAAFEAAEIAEWMRFLFNERRKRDISQLSEVEALQASAIAALPSVARNAEDDEEESQAALADAPTKLAKTTSSTSARTQLRLDEDEEPVVLPTRTGKWVWTALILLLIAGGAGYGYWRYQPQVNAWLGIEAAPEAEPEEEVPQLAVAIETEPDEAVTEEARAEHERVEAEQAAEPQPEGEAQAEGEAEEAAAGEEPAAGEEAEAGEAPTEPAATPEPPRQERRASTRRSARGQAAEAPSTTQASSGDERAPVRPSTTLDFSQGPVLIRTQGGWATVMHGSRNLGRTPLRVQLPVGPQQLRLLPSGREPGRSITVTVEWGSLTTINVTLRTEPAAGSETPGSTEGWDNPY